MAESGPTVSELERSHAQAEANFVYRVQTVGGFGGKSDQLNQYNVFLGDPGYFDRDLDRYRRATPETVRQACATHLDEARRVAVSVVPAGRLDLALPGSAKVVCS
jgi:zinc protease